MGSEMCIRDRYSLVERPSDTFTNGTVIGSNPEAGQPVAANQTVTVFVSSGPTTLVVPEVIGIEATEAVSRLTDAGLASNITEVAGDATAGTVVRSSPAVGEEVADGTVIELSVSSGSSAGCVNVPNVVGQQAPIASNVLTQAGLTVDTAAVANNLAEGTVVGTRPAAGECVERGSSITANVSCASDLVPNVVGLPADLLRVAGFTFQSELQQSSTVPAGTVIATNPVAGTRHCQSIPVVATVATSVAATCNITVPNLVGLTSVTAVRQAEASGLNVTANVAPHPTVPDGRVISSNPAGGETVCRNANLTIVISSGPLATTPTPTTPTPTTQPAQGNCSIQVPAIVSTPEQQALLTLRDLGLVPSTLSQRNNSVPAGFIVSWTADRPVQNGQFCTGDRIFVIVSAGPG